MISNYDRNWTVRKVKKETTIDWLSDADENVVTSECWLNIDDIVGNDLDVCWRLSGSY